MGAARYDPDRRGYRIFVGNLSGVTTHDDLANLFSAYGPIVDVWLASNPPGFGFVVFKNAADAEKAVSEKNSSIYLTRVIKVQHARLFKDRPSTRSKKNGSQGYTESESSRSSRSRSSLSRSRSRSLSRSRSRSSRRWSRSSSRLSYFSRLYGTARKRSKSSSRSRAASRIRSNSSMRTLSVAGSDPKSRSRSPSKSRSRSGTNSRSSRRHHHRPRSSHHHGHRHSKRSRQRRRRRRGGREGSLSRLSHSASHSDLSSEIRSSQSAPSGRSHSSSHSRPKRSTSRPRSPSSRRGRQREAGRCRHCHHCQDHRASSAMSDNSERRASSSSPGPRGLSSRKASKRHRRSWRYSKRSRRRSTSPSPSSSSSSTLSSSSSSSSSRSPLPSEPDSRMTGGGELESSLASDHSGILSAAASQSARLKPNTGTTSPSGTNHGSPSQSHEERPVTSPVVSVIASDTLSTLHVLDSSSSGSLESRDAPADATSCGPKTAGAVLKSETKTVSRCASECADNVTDTAPSGETGWESASASSPESPESSGHLEGVVSERGDGRQTRKRLPLSFVNSTQIRFSLNHKVPCFSLEQSQQAKYKKSARNKSGARNVEQSNVGLPGESGNLNNDSKTSLSTRTTDLMAVCTHVNLSQDLDGPGMEIEEAHSATAKEESSVQQDAIPLKIDQQSAASTPQTATRNSNKCDEKAHNASQKETKSYGKRTDMPITSVTEYKIDHATFLDPALGPAADIRLDHSDSGVAMMRKADHTAPFKRHLNAVQTHDRSSPPVDHRKIPDRTCPHSSSKSQGFAKSGLLSTQNGLSEHKQDTADPSVSDSDWGKHPVKQNSSRTVSSKSSLSPLTHQSRHVICSTGHSSSWSRSENHGGLGQHGCEADKKGYHSHMQYREGRKGSEHAYPAYPPRRLGLSRRRDCNENHQILSKSHEAPWHSHVAQSAKESFHSSAKIRRISSDEPFPSLFSFSDTRESGWVKSGHEEKGSRIREVRTFRGKNQEERKFGWRSVSSVDHAHGDKCTVRKQGSPPSNKYERNKEGSPSADRMPSQHCPGDTAVLGSPTVREPRAVSGVPEHKPVCEVPEGQAGRRVLLPTPRRGLLPKPVRLPFQSAVQRTVGPCSQPSSSFSYPLRKCGAFPSTNGAEHGGPSPACTLFKPSRQGNSVRPTGMKINVDGKNQIRTSPNTSSKTGKAEDSYLKNRPQDQACYKRPQMCNPRQAIRESLVLKTDVPVTARQRAAEKTSHNHKNSCTGKERSPKPSRIRSKILLVKQTWDS